MNTNLPIYDKGIEYLEQNAPEYATVVYGLGTPIANEGISTLMVTPARITDKLESGKARIVMHINPNYLPDASPKNCAGMLIHEAIHVFKEHLLEQVKMKDVDPQVLNVVHESITNDYLDFIGFELPDSLDEDGNVVATARDTYIFGMEHLGFNTIGMNTEAVLANIPDDFKTNSEDNYCSHAEREYEGDDETQADKVYTKFFQFMKDNIEDIPEEMADDIEKLEDGFSDDDVNIRDYEDGSGTGDSFDTVEAEILADKYGTSVEWLKFLHDVCPEFLQDSGAGVIESANADWSRPNIIASSLPENLFMPAYNNPAESDPEMDEDGGDRKPHIVLGLDTSYSIDRKWVKGLRKLIASIPTDLIDVDAFTFSTYPVKYDIDNNKNKIADGGTSFRTAVDFMNQEGIDQNNENLKVIMITDGQAPYHYPSNPESYVWCLFNEYDRYSLPRQIEDKQVRYMKDFFDIYEVLNG